MTQLQGQPCAFFQGANDLQEPETALDEALQDSAEEEIEEKETVNNAESRVKEAEIVISHGLVSINRLKTQ